MDLVLNAPMFVHFDSSSIFIKWVLISASKCTGFCYTKNTNIEQGRSHWADQGEDSPPLQFSNQRRPKSFSFKHQVYCFIAGLLHHVGLSEKVLYLTLDLLKSFSLWTIQKKTAINESLNSRL